MDPEDFLGKDLDLGFRPQEEGWVVAGPDSDVDLQAGERQGVFPRLTDLKVVGGRSNLIQSLILRIKTEQGELESLGHPSYGSKHHRLLGEPNTEANRNLLKLYLLECLKQEPRIEGILSLEVRPFEGRENKAKVNVQVRLRVKGAPEPLILVVPFSFRGPLE